MADKVNITALVDVIGALSERTLRHGNLIAVDDGALESTGQGTPELCSTVFAGQTVEWSALAVDVQTPVVIRGISFLRPDGLPVPFPAAAPAAPAVSDDADETADAGGQQNPDALVWSGVVPSTMARGVPYRYRLELQMGQGDQSVLSIDTPALMHP